MVLNYVWVGFIIVSFIVALLKLVFLQDTEIFSKLVYGTLESAKTGFTVALGLTGALTLWMGLMRVGENAGSVNFLSRMIGPFFLRLFPEIPAGHPALGHIMLNFSANMLGLSNAATPMGLKAMESMQELNPEKERASNSMIMFLTLNTAGFTLIPVSILAIRATQGAADPTDVFIPILMSSLCATIFGMIVVSVWQRIFTLALAAWIGSALVVLGGLIALFMKLSPEMRSDVSNIAGNVLIMSIIVAFLLAAMRQRQNAFTSFIDGAKEGFQTAVRIIPYLVGMLVAIGLFRNCGALDYISNGTAWAFAQLGIDTRFTPALPVAYMKPLSGGGTEGLTVELIKSHGVDSFVGRLSSIMYASADTTFYIIALYFGSVGIKRTRYAVGAGLLADLAGITAAILIAYLFFG
jgi:spore maturation protein SpmA